MPAARKMCGEKATRPGQIRGIPAARLVAVNRRSPQRSGMEDRISRRRQGKWRRGVREQGAPGDTPCPRCAVGP